MENVKYCILRIQCYKLAAFPESEPFKSAHFLFFIIKEELKFGEG